MPALFLVHIRILQQFGEAHHRLQRVVQFVRHAGDEFAHGGKFFALHQLCLRGFERGDGLLELRLRRLDIFGHAVERRGELATLIAAAHGDNGFAEEIQRVVIAGRWNVAKVTDDLPRRREDLLLFSA